MTADRHSQPDASPDRRHFLKGLGALSAALTAGAASAGPKAPELPQIQLGKHSVSRLICGANPFNAGSHLSTFVNRQMREYFTPEQILKTLRRCQEVGINCWQSGLGNVDLYRRLVDEGCKMHYLALDAGGPEAIAKLVQAGAIGIAHHGEVTDTRFKQGQLDRIQEYLKRVRDAGVLVGVSTHMPAVVDAIESKGWDIDYYMTCVYERHRTEAELKQLLGHVPLPVREVYLREDPPRMFKAMQATRRPCLAFKILAAGRLSEHQGWVEQAFRETFAAIKPSDAVILGIYDRYSDQPAEAADYTRRFASRRSS